MPKIIENLDVKLMEEARRQINEAGYGKVTIRSIAKACGVGVGTVYNYFPSKDALLATYMLADWRSCMEAIEESAANHDSPQPVVRCIYVQIKRFADIHQSIFRDEAAIASFHNTSGQYHAMLRSQLAAPLGKFCTNDFAPEFIAEALLSWAMTDKTFEELFEMIKMCF